MNAPAPSQEDPLDGLAPRSRRFYAGTWRRFQAFQQQHPALPVPEQLRAFLAPFTPRHAADVRTRLFRFLPAEVAVAVGAVGRRAPGRRTRAWGTGQDGDAGLPPQAAAWSRVTRHQRRVIYARFERYRATCPGRPLTEQAIAFLAALPVNSEHTARGALKAKYRRAIEWDDVPRRRAWRNEALLQGTLFDRDAELAQLEAALTTPRDRALVGLAWSLRRAEVVRARWRDVDLDRGTVAVVGKGGRASWTILTPGTVAALRALRVIARPEPDALIVPSRLTGGEMSPAALTNWFRTFLHRHGLYRPWRGLHALRRSFATRFLRYNPEALVKLQRLMRHSSIATTALYCYPSQEDLASAVARAFGPHGGDHAR